MNTKHDKDTVSEEPPARCSQLALEKAKIVAPLRGLKTIPLEQMAEVCQAGGVLLNRPEGEVSHQTIRNWLAILERDGPAGLDRKPRQDRGATRIQPKLEGIIRGILLSPKRFSIAEAHRRVRQYARDHLRLPSEDIPSRKQVAYVWKHIPEEEKVLAFEGIQGYRRKFDQHIRFEAPHPNAMWQADHHQLDLIVVDAESGEARGRPYITTIQDDYSRAIVGYYLSLEHPSSMHIALALHHAFLPKPQEWWVMHGIPNILYVDNGKDFVSRHIEHVCLHFGIELLRHEPYHPQSKGKVERWFETLEKMLIHTLDGSVGSSLMNRPRSVKPKLTLGDVEVQIERFIREYHERKHSTTRQTPLSRWVDNETSIRTVKNLEDIDHLLMSKPYKVQRDGIHFRYARYRDRDHFLAGYIGRHVTVFFNPRDTSCIRVWAPDSTGVLRFLCTATPETPMAASQEVETEAAENRRRRDRIRRRVREAQEDGNAVLRVLETESVDYHESHLVENAGNEAPETDEDIIKPATGLLLAHQSLRVKPQSAPDDGNDDDDGDEVDMDALRRQMIRARRHQS